MTIASIDRTAAHVSGTSKSSGIAVISLDLLITTNCRPLDDVATREAQITAIRAMARISAKLYRTQLQLA